MFPCEKTVIYTNSLIKWNYFIIPKDAIYIFFVSVISCKSQFPNYISALLPQDQIFEPDTDFQFEQSPVKKKKERQTEETEEGEPFIYLYRNKFLK